MLGEIVLILAVVTTASAGEPQQVRQTVANRLTGSRFMYTVAAGDSLTKVSARFGVPVGTLAHQNGLSSRQIIHPGDILIIDNRHVAAMAAPLTLNIPQRMLFLNDREQVRAYPVAVGRADWPTPEGPFSIVGKEENPTWDVPPSIQAEMRRLGQPVQARVPPGPSNPLGAFFIRLSFPNIGLHGTNAPASIYRFVTHGCVRFNSSDIADLYRRVAVGMTGLSVYQPVLVAIVDEGIWLEVHPDPYARARPSMATVTAMMTKAGIADRVDWTTVADVVARVPGIAVDVSHERDRSGRR